MSRLPIQFFNEVHNYKHTHRVPSGPVICLTSFDFVFSFGVDESLPFEAVRFGRPFLPISARKKRKEEVK